MRRIRSTMKIDFSSITFDLRNMIAKKMDFWTLLQLQLSSKEGKIVGNSASRTVALEVEMILFIETKVRFLIYNQLKQRRVNKRWDELRIYPDLPRFSVRLIKLWPDREMELRIFSDLARDASFLWTKLRIDWGKQKRDASEIFLKLDEMFNATEFHFSEINAPDCPDEQIPFLLLPQQLKMESVSFRGNSLPAEWFAAQKAQTIVCHLQGYNDTILAMNLYFQQWIRMEREIRSIKIFHDWPSRCDKMCEKMLQDLPYSFVCSNANLIDWYNGTIKTYVLDRGDRQLEIEERYHSVTVSHYRRSSCL